MVLVFLMSVSTIVYPAAGDLDTDFAGFSSDGRLDVSGMSTRAMALQPDGKIIAVGSSGDNIVVKRFRADGTEDTGFNSISIDLGAGGTCSNAFPYSYSLCGVALQENGRIVVVADSTLGATRDFAVLRFFANGNPDNGFGVGGMAIVDFDGQDDLPADVAIQEDGKIVVVGSVGIEKNNAPDVERFGVARLNSDGTLDTTFSNDGKANNGFDSDLVGNETHIARAVAIQPDGKIVVAGTARDYGLDTDLEFGVARYNTDGSLDSSFSGDGKKTIAIDGDDSAWDVAIAPDGKIVLAGHSGGSSGIVDLGTQIALVRLEADGDLDSTFNGDGKFSASLKTGELENLMAVAVQSDGRVVAAGHVDTEVYLFRFTSAGEFDGSFSVDGQNAYIDGLARDLIIQPDGKYLLMYGDGIYRIRPDSLRDQAGDTITSFGDGDDRAFGITVQGDGKPIVVGDSVQPGLLGREFAVVRYREDGQLDPGFGDSGMVLIGPKNGEDAGRSVAVQQDGRILVAGHSENSDFDFALHRLDENGDQDIGFTRYADFGKGDDFAVSVLIQPDGKIVLVGFAQIGVQDVIDRYGIALVRYLPNGNLDPGFNATGMVVTPVPLGGATTRARSAKLLSNGKILVVGTHDQDVLVLRYNANGTLDTNFGTDGIVLADRALTNDIGFGVGIIQSDHIAIGGMSGINDFSLLILGPDGGQCTVCGLLPFGEQYWLSVDFDVNKKETAYALVVQDNGRILLAGSPTEGVSIPYSARIRNNSLIQGPGFRLDTSYGGDGKTSGIASGNAFGTSARALTLHGLGVFIAGYQSNGHDNDFYLQKLENDSESYPDGKPTQELIFLDGFEN